MANVAHVDYYEVLSVSRECGDQELKTAYRKLAMQFHPDRNPDNPEAEERFKQASEAYQVLSDPEKRAAYDRYGHAGVSGAAGAGAFPAAWTWAISSATFSERCSTSPADAAGGRPAHSAAATFAMT